MNRFFIEGELIVFLGYFLSNLNTDNVSNWNGSAQGNIAATQHQNYGNPPNGPVLNAHYPPNFPPNNLNRQAPPLSHPNPPNNLNCQAPPLTHLNNMPVNNQLQTLQQHELLHNNQNFGPQGMVNNNL